MKYIVFLSAENDREIPIIFPSTLVHLDVAKVMSKVVGTSKVTAAGELSSLDIDATCHGESTTIGIKSRGEVDSRLIAAYDYSFGMVK